MKKLITMLLAFVLVSSIVLAQGNSSVNNSQPEGTGQGNGLVNNSQPEGNIKTPRDGEKPEEAGNPKVTSNNTVFPKGLSIALTKVKNENATKRLQQNIERFAEKYQQRLKKMEGLEIETVDNETGAVTLKARETVRFFGFIKGKATKRFNINAEGKIEEKAPWYRFLYTDVKSE